MSPMRYKIFDPKKEMKECGPYVLGMKPYHDPAKQTETVNSRNQDVIPSEPKDVYKGPIKRFRIKASNLNDSGELSF